MAEVLNRRVPTVFVDGPEVPGHSYVGIDNRAAGARPIEHLIDLGHRRIAVVSFRLIPDGYVGPIGADRIAGIRYQVTRDRLGGMLDAHRGAGEEGLNLYEVGRNDRDTAAQMAYRLLSSDGAPTAIVALSDQIGLGVIDAARRLGLSVPGDLSVTGFDDIVDAGEARLTTVRQPAFEKRRVAGRLLVSGDHPSRVLLDHELVVRQSTGPPRPDVALPSR